MNRSMIFHHPLPVAGGASGSGVRPAAMLASFRELGYDVEEVVGFGSDRRRAAQRILGDVGRGRTFDFVYGESATTPNALSDPSHLPTHPLLDAGFFARMRRAGIPSGVFYRDIYWRSAEYRSEATAPKRVVAHTAYRADLAMYRRLVDVLFLPSLQMADELPQRLRHPLVHPLPPGGSPQALPGGRPPDGALHLLYVGGVRPPLYDMRPLFDVLRADLRLRLTVSCRPEEAGHLPAPPPNVTLLHASGTELSELYRRADLSLAFFAQHGYRTFAVPVKLFESVAHGIPVVVNEGTAACEVVDRYHLGFCARDSEDLVSRLDGLLQEPGRLQELRAAVARARPEHTWRARAAEAATVIEAHRR